MLQFYEMETALFKVGSGRLSKKGLGEMFILDCLFLILDHQTLFFIDRFSYTLKIFTAQI